MRAFPNPKALHLEEHEWLVFGRVREHFVTSHILSKDSCSRGTLPRMKAAPSKTVTVSRADFRGKRGRMPPTRKEIYDAY
jgi:hypothetical protein